MSTGHSDAPSVPVCSAIAPNPEVAHFDPAWRTSTVGAIAKGIAAEGTFDAMPILADALQDAGCDNTLLLDHCRHATGHTAACWALHLIRSPQVAPAPAQQPAEPIKITEAARFIIGAPAFTGRWDWFFVTGLIHMLTSSVGMPLGQVGCWLLEWRGPVASLTCGLFATACLTLSMLTFLSYLTLGEQRPSTRELLRARRAERQRSPR
ncbi:Uncharacterized protein (Fragment) OS=uncultured bacterium PE=4 SV=1 [Gemmataceae bacterium]